MGCSWELMHVADNRYLKAGHYLFTSSLSKLRPGVLPATLKLGPLQSRPSALFFLSFFFLSSCNNQVHHACSKNSYGPLVLLDLTLLIRVVCSSMHAASTPWKWTRSPAQRPPNHGIFDFHEPRYMYARPWHNTSHATEGSSEPPVLKNGYSS